MTGDQPCRSGQLPRRAGGASRASRLWAVPVAAALLTGCGANATERSGEQTVAHPSAVAGEVAPSEVAVVPEGDPVPAERVAGYRDLAVRAVGQVEDLWGVGAVPRPVLVVPTGDAATFAALTGHDPAEQEVPASTVTRGGLTRVVVHSAMWDRLTPAGRQAMLTHEVTHLAMQGDGPVPAWLGEGLAELTAYRATGLSPEEVAGPTLAEVAAGRAPDHWPDPGEADHGRGYALSWLACRYLADEASEEQLLTVYDRVAAGEDVGTVLAEAYGRPEDRLVRDWADWLAAAAGQE